MKNKNIDLVSERYNCWISKWRCLYNKPVERVQTPSPDLIQWFSFNIYKTAC